MSRWAQFYETVRRIPPGKVATYGQVAREAGLPRHARQVGYALAALSEADAATVPWHRVINARGEISARGPAGELDWAGLQRHRLEREGIQFDTTDRVDLGVYGWSPEPRL